jgi:hypothetical protein
LVEQIAGGKALPDEVVDQIADRTDGVPLFVEELTRSVLESGLLREKTDRYVLDRVLPPFAIPTSLHDSLMARLDRLASAQIGAAVGREFSYELLRAVSRLPEDELQAALGRLVDSELVSQRGRPPDAVYIFKHALVQDASHGSLLRSSRQQLHAQIAEPSKPIPPSLWTASLSSSRSIMRRLGSLKNPSHAGVRLVEDPPPARRWRKRPRNSKRGWTNWRYCPVPPTASARSSNCAVAWARPCWSLGASQRRKPGMHMPAPETCGSSWVHPQSSLGFPLGSQYITCTAANSIWRCAFKEKTDD